MGGSPFALFRVNQNFQFLHYQLQKPGKAFQLLFYIPFVQQMQPFKRLIYIKKKIIGPAWERFMDTFALGVFTPSLTVTSETEIEGS